MHLFIVNNDVLSHLLSKYKMQKNENLGTKNHFNVEMFDIRNNIVNDIQQTLRRAANKTTHKKGE